MRGRELERGGDRNAHENTGNPPHSRSANHPLFLLTFHAIRLSFFPWVISPISTFGAPSLALRPRPIQPSISPLFCYPIRFDLAFTPTHSPLSKIITELKEPVSAINASVRPRCFVNHPQSCNFFLQSTDEWDADLYIGAYVSLSDLNSSQTRRYVRSYVRT